MNDLYQKTQKKLVVTVVDIQSANVLYLDHTNEGRDVPILKAVMGSMALPPIFPFSSHGLMSFVDGGLLDNFPLRLFDPEKTLGVSTAWYIDPSNPTQDICSFYTRILSIVQIPIHKEQVELFKLYNNRVFIDLGNVNADNTSVDTKSLIFQGYRASITRFAADGPTVNAHGPKRFLQ
jgi:predicted acylesterase/phospholipase RssA